MRPAPVLLLAALACAPAPPPPRPLFVDVTAAAGLDLPISADDPATQPTILEVNGSGGALLDLDGDGRLDLAVARGSSREEWSEGLGSSVLLFRNAGVVEGVPRFEAAPPLPHPGWPTGVTSGDVDGDGRPDLVVGGLGADVLYLNRTEPGGPVRMEPQGLPGRRSPLDWTTSLGLADADGDGRLDLYLVRYLEIDPADPPLGDIEGVPCEWMGMPVMCGPQGLPPQADVFLRGTDGPPWFREATAEAGLDVPPPAYGLGLLFMDLDDDGLPDLYVANDSVDNVLLGNQGDGTFRDMSSASGAAADLAGRAQAGMGVAAGDLDGDGDFDLAVTNFSEESHTLYRNDGELLFRDISAPTGLSRMTRPLLGWGVHLADLDGDGRLDLLFVNGHVYPEADAGQTGTRFAQPVVLLPGRADGTFGENAFPDPTPRLGRSALRGDLDGDGDLDLVVLCLDGQGPGGFGRARLYLNHTDDPGRMLLVTLVDAPPAAPDALGATLRVRTAAGWLVRQRVASQAFQGASDPRLHLAGSGPVLEAEVRWPGGARERLDPERLRFGHHLEIHRGQGVVSAVPLEALP